MGVLVVTGTGTGIGKTVVTTAVAALAGHGRQTSCPSGAWQGQVPRLRAMPEHHEAFDALLA